MRRQFQSSRNVVYSCQYHVVWCPKYRRRVLVQGVDERLKRILREVATERRAEIIEMEVMPDHVHLLVSVDPRGASGRYMDNHRGRYKTPVLSFAGWFLEQMIRMSREQKT